MAERPEDEAQRIEAETIFAAWATRRDAGEAEPFQQVLEGHRLLRAELEALHADLELFEPILEKMVPGQFTTNGALWIEPQSSDEASAAASNQLFESLGANASLTSRYKFRNVLGSGGGGVVLRVWDTKLDRMLAMKIAMADWRSPSAQRDARVDHVRLVRFVNEARITSQLSHPGIVPIHDLGTTDQGLPYYSMKLVGGENLSQIFDHVRLGRNDWTHTKALLVVLRICEAVAAAHEKGVIHRDLKPTNIMVGKHGEVHVMDWGSACVLGKPESQGAEVASSVTSEGVGAAYASTVIPLRNASNLRLSKSGEIVGTPAYMSPEQALGQVDRVDARTDVYAIGAILYELLSGHAPFLGTSPHPTVAELLKSIAEETPTPLLTIDAELAPELVAISERAMARNPSLRHPSTNELKQDIEAFLEGKVVPSYRTDRWTAFNKWWRRNRVLSATVVLLACTIVVGTLASLVSAHRADVARGEAAQRTDEVLSLSALQVLDEQEVSAEQLWPPHPVNIEKYDAWIARARDLIEGHPADPSRNIVATPSLRQREQMLEALRSKATEVLEWKEGDKDDPRPERAELKRAREERVWLAHLLDADPWPQDQTAEEQAARDCIDLPSTELSHRAYALVGMTSGGRDFVSFKLARATAALAVSRCSVMDLTDARLTYAKSLYNCADFDGARRAMKAALDGADPNHLEQTQVASNILETFIRRWEVPELREVPLEYVAALDRRIPRLERELSEGKQYRFADDRDRWQHEQLSKLVARLRGLQDSERGLLEGTLPQFGWSVQYRREFAASVAQRSVESPEMQAKWAKAIEAIANSCGGLRIQPRVGLVPIGQDPVSRLWEFAHLATGEAPTRDAEGKLQFTKNSAVVLVLIPPGRARIGASKAEGSLRVDPYALLDESPIHEVDLDAFLLSKFELTQAQWVRLGMKNASQFPIDSVYETGVVGKTDPIEFVSYDDCLRVLGHVGLNLPTEVQWEYACRAGTESLFSCGSDMKPQKPAFNLSDRRLRRVNGPVVGSAPTDEIDDGYPWHAPVGSYPPNAFGVHDMHGNVWEWCRDEFGSYSYPARSGDGARSVAFTATRVVRGGSFLNAINSCRSSARGTRAPADRAMHIGVRPSMDIVPR